MMPAASGRSAPLLGVLRCRLDRAWLSGLRRVFHFDAWHASAPYSCRPYKAEVVALANSLKPASVVEVGCGLGDILSRVSARARYGFDADARVIRAARFLHPRGVHWIHGEAAGVARALLLEGSIDCMIMVNWIHNLSAEELAGVVLPLLPRIRYLIVDAIDADGPASYRHKHDFRFLAGLTRHLSSTHPAHELRSLLLFEVLR
jgi:SAM-dependent methyltransferase